MHWWILIIIAAFNVLLLFANMRFLYFYMHVDDYKYNQGILAQIIALIGGQIVCMLCTLLPTDVYNATYDGGLNMLYYWQLVYLFVCVYLTSILPFAVFFYEADSDVRLSKTPPWRKAVINTAITSTACWAIIGLLYLISHRVETEVETALQDEVPNNEIAALSFTMRSETKKSSLAFLTFLVALPGFFGWLLLMFQGGVGLASLPLSLIQQFISRPQPILPAQYERMRKILGERAQALRKVGETLKKKEGAISAKSGVTKAAQRVKFRSRLAKFKQVVHLLENEYDMLEEAYKKRGMNPLKAWGVLTLGVIFMALTIAWILQIFVCMLVPDITGRKPTFTLMSQLLQILAKSRILAPDLVLYLILSGYFVAASLHGNIRISLRIQSCLPMQPLKKADTHLNALLFHIALCILSATAVVQLTYEAFTGYSPGTEAEVLFSLQRFHIKLFSNFYRRYVFVWVMVVVCTASFVWLIIFPQERPAYDLLDPKTISKWERLQAELGVEDDGMEEMKELAEEIGPKEEDKGPSLGERAKARMGRVDNAIEGAPGKVFNMGMRNAVPGNLT